MFEPKPFLLYWRAFKKEGSPTRLTSSHQQEGPRHRWGREQDAWVSPGAPGERCLVLGRSFASSKENLDSGHLLGILWGKELGRPHLNVEHTSPG